MSVSDDLEKMVEGGELSQEAYEKFQRCRFEEARPGDEVILTEDGEVILRRQPRRNRYLQDEETEVCPFCHSPRIVIGPVSLENPPHRDCTCRTCSRPWRDILRMVVVDVIPR